MLSEFGARVRAARLEGWMSQEQLGFAAGLHPTYITGIERGQRNLGLRNLVAIAAAPGTNPADLVDGLRRD